jgi:hypothetical protein
VLALALASGFVAWLVLRPGSDRPSPQTAGAPAAARLVSSADLGAVGASLGRPLFWAGPRAGMRYELTQAAAGRTYVRYLPAGVAAGDRRPRFLAIGTYPQRGAYAQVSAAAARPGAVTLKLPGGGIAFYSRNRPTSVYVAYPGSNVQVEVYDPSPRLARALVLTGQVAPIK